MQERIQKLIARCGIASRRAAEEMILAGEVAVNGKVVRILGSKADPVRDHIKVRGQLINPQLAQHAGRYLLLNKPKGYLSSASDPKRRPLALDLIPISIRHGLKLVGRLDFNTEGLLLLSNDGDFANAITKAGKVPKVYHVKVKGMPSEEQVDRLRRGVRIGGAPTAPAEIQLVDRTREGGNAWFEVTLWQGKNQQIKKMFDSTGHSVTKLRRVKIGHLTDKGLGLGQFRELTPAEVKRFQEYKKGPGEPSSRRASVHGARASSGPSTRPGPGRRSELSSGARWGHESEPRSGSGSRPHSGSGSGSRPGSHSGPGPRPHSEHGSGSNSGPRSGAGSKPYAERGSRPGSGPRSGPGSGPRPGSGSRPYSERGSRPGSASRPGSGSRSNSRQGSRPGSGPRPGDGSRPNIGRGSEPSSGPRQGQGSRPGSKSGSAGGPRPNNASRRPDAGRPGGRPPYRSKGSRPSRKPR